eukprot:scaffold10390_cov226-Chaetoceros_neogracile.AAC.1
MKITAGEFSRAVLNAEETSFSLLPTSDLIISLALRDMKNPPPPLTLVATESLEEFGCIIKAVAFA